MKRTAEEIAALAVKRRDTNRDAEKAARRKRVRGQKLEDRNFGQMVKALLLTDEEQLGMLRDAQDKRTREKWARMGRGNIVPHASDELPTAAD